MSFKGYEAKQDEVLVALANTDLFEQIEVGNGSSSSGERDSQNKATDKQNEVPTPLKAENSLNTHFVDTMEVDEDVSRKRNKLSEPRKEVVDIEDEDDKSINKGKATIVEEESQE